ncbi:ABC transporter substrate-binding protein [Niveispirillum irakense]|uniref:ABC transporter substrate-binding protein n=1 Tax=Niveispirillum irakense TaxID=34011 RepID=UPI0006843FD2|nr:ABC transporter substrate-binding protein [Niveispirillum irakense]
MRWAARYFLAAALSVAGSTLALAGEGAAHPRVVSLSLCTDQFVLALADPGQIAGLTAKVGDPVLSPYAARAAGLPLHDGTAETVLLLKPDLVIAGTFSRGQTVTMLERLGVPVLRLQTARTLADIPAQVEQVANALGRGQEGAALAADLRARLVPSGHSLGTAALYRPGGEVPGTRSIVNDMMAAAGLTNIGGRISGRPNGRVAVESLVLDPPDLLVVDSRRPDRPGIGQSVMEHPALSGQHAAGAMAVAEFPLLYWLCSSPASIDGVGVLAGRATQALAMREGAQ